MLKIEKIKDEIKNFYDENNTLRCYLAQIAPMIRKRDLRDIYISENVKVTIDLEDVKKEIANQFYNPLRVGNIK
ncbi:hypothetical protein DW681_14185 [Thomasclavelia ramosa]|uniref:hypothetical protein n=1 Tax=Thomasclavelia ramosa TaxID=1547 RepID=UPI000E4B6EE7|nr:hypothetical protein [Thomasclavelia ramosa]RHF40484.1 hypothetical protein DW681_14185 [Thomasclavelia ramosa]